MAAFGPNEWLVDELYQQYLRDKSSVDRAWWEFFADYTPGDPLTRKDAAPVDGGARTNGSAGSSPEQAAPEHPAPQQPAPSQKPAPQQAAPQQSAPPQKPAPAPRPQPLAETPPA